MSCLGVCFALEEGMVDKLKSVKRAELVGLIKEEIETDFFENKRELMAEFGKSWYAIQLAFSGNCNDLRSKKCESPLSYLICGSQVLYGDKEDEEGYIVTLKTPQEVRDIYNALTVLTESAFKEKYHAIDEKVYDYSLSEEDFEYTWGWLMESIPFWQTASENGLYVIFTADQ
ncbi:MAG: YfbM family protein [Zoogloeaceae bacterium]|jgi:hypothetical protein|nr:YfbM family protein [Zoogloeaceae bacterium]